MGRSAKVHKRMPKKITSSISGPLNGGGSKAGAQVKLAKQKSAHKVKAKGSGDGKGGGSVLGGADYLGLMMGGRRKAREEARKLSKED